jgi:hypothetical protein
MPRLQEHLDKAEHNENYYQSFDLDNTPYLDWVVNGIFYSAVHYVDAYFATNKFHPDTHRKRIRHIQLDKNLGRDFYINWYKPIDQHSRAGRYNMKVFTTIEVRQDIIPLLSGVKQHLQQFTTIQSP